MTGKHFYEFGKFRLDADGRVLYCGDERVSLTPKAMETLLLLVENRGHPVEKDELMRRIWPDTFVEEGSLTRNISVLRKVLGEGPDGHEFIETIPKRGYRFVATVRGGQGTRGASTRGGGGNINLLEDRTFPSPAPAESKLNELQIAPAVLRKLPSRRLMAIGLAALTVAALILERRHLRFQQVAPSGRKMLAVLPVEDLSGGQEHEYISDGLTEEMIAQLSPLSPQKLGVIARTSVMAYKKTHKTVAQIGTELHVDYVVETSIRMTGEQIRVTAQLVQVRDQTHLWSHSYDRNLSDILSLEADIAQTVAGEILRQVAPESAVRPAAPPLNSAAHLAYLEGRYYWNKRTRASLEKSVALFRQAIQADANYAQAYAGLAQSYASLALLDTVPPRDIFPMVEIAARQALRLDDSSADAHAALGYVRSFFDWDWLGAEEEYQTAIHLNAGDATAHQWYAEYLRFMGREQESIEESKKALELDPLSLVINMESGLPYYFMGQDEEATRRFRRTLQLESSFAMAHNVLGLALEDQERYPEAIAEIEQARRLDDTDAILATLGNAYAQAGRRADAQKVISELEERARHTYVPGVYFAFIYNGLHEDEQALDWLEKAYAEHSWALVWLNVGRLWKRLGSNPRFMKLIQRMNFPPSHR